MTAIIKATIEELQNPDFLRDLQEKYGKAELEIHVNPERSHVLTDEDFWKLIALLEWSKEEDDEAVTKPLVQALAALPVGFIYQFEDKLSEKLYQLDTAAHAQAYQKHEGNAEHLSVDDFLYVRAGVVANGQAVFEAVLQNPEEMPDVSFESLLNVASDAYERKTNKLFDYIPVYNYETYSNQEGWQ